MYVVVQHRISDPEAFSAAAQQGMANLPEHLRIHHVLPNAEGSGSVCLWEAESIDTLRDFLEPSIGQVSRNEYYEVHAPHAFGLPQQQTAQQDAPSREQIEKAVRQYFAAIRARDADAWTDAFAEDAVSHDPVGAPPHLGHEGVRHFFEQINAPFQEVSLQAQEMFIAGNSAAVKWRGEGTGKNGRDVTFEGIDIFEVNDQGKIQTLRAYWNPQPMIEQLQG